MSREWQQTKMQEYVMPYAVYYQSLWAVRDLERMEMRIRELKNSRDTGVTSCVVAEGRGTYGNDRPVEGKALELAMLEERVEGIKNALGNIPSAYRKFVLSNIILKNPGSAFPDKMWRAWKQRFLFDVARNLSMM